MNKIILLGRLTKDPEVRYSNAAEPMAIARYTLAVNRRFKRDGEPEADFINCVAFGKRGEFAEKYYRKGQQVLVEGELRIENWDDEQGVKHWATKVIIGSQFFADSKRESGNSAAPAPQNQDGFYPINENIEDDDLPF